MFWLVTKLIKKTEKLKPDKLLSTERETFNISIFQPNQTINMKSHSSGSSELLPETPTCTSLKLWLLNQLKSKWIKTKLPNLPTNGRKSKTLLFQTKKTKISNDCLIHVFILFHSFLVNFFNSIFLNTVNFSF